MSATGLGYDCHRFSEGRRLVLGGVEIAYERGLRGHSDADVAAHALANAILGALGAGDFGRHFSDQDPKYKDADSLELLAAIWRLAAGRGFRLVNADVTIMAERPRLGPFLDRMRSNLAAALEAAPESINVKASSPEGLGALGRADGMMAAAVVLLEAD